MPTAGTPGRKAVEAAHMGRFEANLADVERLLAIHREIAGGSKGRKHNVEVLNKSGIVLLVACWEAFIEDLAEAAFDALLEHVSDPATLPPKLQTQASAELKSSSDDRRVWELAGDGWKEVLKRHRRETLKRHLSSFNTPKPEQIDTLFEDLLGLRSLSQSWKWPRSSPSRGATTLRELVALRGSIAHRVCAAKAVKKRDVWRAGMFLIRLSVCSHNRVLEHLKPFTGFAPWDEYAQPNERSEPAA